MIWLPIVRDNMLKRWGEGGGEGGLPKIGEAGEPGPNKVIYLFYSRLIPHRRLVLSIEKKHSEFLIFPIKTKRNCALFWVDPHNF